MLFPSTSREVLEGGMTHGLNLGDLCPSQDSGQVYITFLHLKPGWTINPHSDHMD